MEAGSLLGTEHLATVPAKVVSKGSTGGREADGFHSQRVKLTGLRR